MPLDGRLYRNGPPRRSEPQSVVYRERLAHLRRVAQGAWILWMANSYWCLHAHARRDPYFRVRKIPDLDEKPLAEYFGLTEATVQILFNFPKARLFIRRKTVIANIDALIADFDADYD